MGYSFVFCLAGVAGVHTRIKLVGIACDRRDGAPSGAGFALSVGFRIVRRLAAITGIYIRDSEAGVACDRRGGALDRASMAPSAAISLAHRLAAVPGGDNRDTLLVSPVTAAQAPTAEQASDCPWATAMHVALLPSLASTSASK